MGRLSDNIKKSLYRNLSLNNYLKVVSRMFFIGYRLGLDKNSPAYEYPHFLKHLVRQGDTVIDIGANLGYYSRILSAEVGQEGKIYAVEPVKPILKVLKHNLRRCTNVEILPYALGSENKSITLGNDSSQQSGYMGSGRNYVMEDQANAELEFSAEMRCGSQLFAELGRLDFVKCDIEGYESVVIPEMAPIIEKFLPVVLIETGDKPAALKIFGEWGYTGYVLLDGRLVHVMCAPEKDIVFIPAHRHAEFVKLIEK